MDQYREHLVAEEASNFLCTTLWSRYYIIIIIIIIINHLIKIIVLVGPKHTEVTDDCHTQPKYCLACRPPDMALHPVWVYANRLDSPKNLPNNERRAGEGR